MSIAGHLCHQMCRKQTPSSWHPHSEFPVASPQAAIDSAVYLHTFNKAPYLLCPQGPSLLPCPNVRVQLSIRCASFHDSFRLYPLPSTNINNMANAPNKQQLQPSSSEEWLFFQLTSTEAVACTDPCIPTSGPCSFFYREPLPYYTTGSC